MHLAPPNTEREDANTAQAFDITQGAQPLGCSTDQHIVNGALLTVIRITAEIVWLGDEETHKICQLTHAGVPRHTRLRHAITIAASQGRALDGVVRVWDVHVLHFDTTHLYVPCTWCRGAEYLQVMSGDGLATTPRMRWTSYRA